MLSPLWTLAPAPGLPAEFYAARAGIGIAAIGEFAIEGSEDRDIGIDVELEAAVEANGIFGVNVV